MNVMEVQSLVTQSLASKCIPYIPSHKSYAQFKYSLYPRMHRPHKFECTIGYCRNVCHGNDRDLKSSCVRSWRIKPCRRMCISFASKNNNEPPLPEEENPEEKDESDITGSVQNLDWRAFRAKLFTAEQIGKSSKNDSRSGSEAESGSEISVGSKWAHPLYEPEPGCVLIATERLDGIPDFERTVILLLHVDAECPFGLILNRPMHGSLVHRRPTHPDMATVFSDCSLRFGGPLEENMFLLISEDKNAVSDSFEEVFPGLYYGARDSLHHAAELVRGKVLLSQNFQFFQGYSSWGFDQLKEEIASYKYWHVAACSPNLIISAISTSSSDLWEEILQLMGDKYAELSRKPKQDNV
ncbi:uncharacterized protein LOC131046606 [Cryptomeria japonica]|uniref:uncharacterized protein LOC131046606 n=1 Tax=Cryptomeria japonica TaxID=3369 RepID=UPI0025ABEB94|nr:uncharacterized protein LOC131046606 [Cryptomeria japonica]